MLIFNIVKQLEICDKHDFTLDTIYKEKSSLLQKFKAEYSFINSSLRSLMA